MSQQFDNTNRFVLFKNDKGGVETRPDYRGSINVNGVEYWLSAWIKESAKGKFLSGSIKPKEAKPESASTSAPAAAAKPDFDDEIPF